MKKIIKNLQDFGAIGLLEAGLAQTWVDGENQDPFAERRRGIAFHRVTNLPTINQDEIHEWENTRPFVLEEFEPTDIDLLAWYQPHSAYGPSSWGIYFDEAKMNSYARSIYALTKRVRPLVHPHLVQRVVWDEVMRHEIEHAVQELTAATLNSFLFPTSGSALDVYRRQARTFEALATHYMHTDTRYRSRRGAPGDFEFVRHVSASAPKPPGYRDWNKIDITSSENNAFGLPLQVQVSQIAGYMRKCLKEPFSAKFLEIPVYIA